MQSRQAGIVIVLVATVLWSTAGVFVHIAALDMWTVVAWKSASAFCALSLFWIAAARGKTEAFRATWSVAGLVAVLIGVVSGFAYVLALQKTSVANVMTVYAGLPFIASAIAFFALRERTTTNFIVCGLVALVGILVMTSAAVTADDVVGIAAAVVMTTGFASALVQSKKYPFLDMTLVTLGSSAVSALICLPLMNDSLPQPNQLLACALLGALTTGLANVLSLKGGRLIRSGEAGLLSLPDVILGPLWVWLAFNEQVGARTLVGGGIVMIAVIVYLLRPGETNPLKDMSMRQSIIDARNSKGRL